MRLCEKSCRGGVCVSAVLRDNGAVAVTTLDCFCKLHNEPHTIETSLRARFGRCACASERDLTDLSSSKDAAAWDLLGIRDPDGDGVSRVTRVFWCRADQIRLWSCGLNSPSKECPFSLGGRFAVISVVVYTQTCRCAVVRAAVRRSDSTDGTIDQPRGRDLPSTEGSEPRKGLQCRMPQRDHQVVICGGYHSHRASSRLRE